METSPRAPVLDVLEQQPWLDRVGDSVRRAVDPLFEGPRGDRLGDLLHGTWLGHALHPVLTDATIGLWSSSLLLDFLGAHKSATVLNLAGSGSALATAATGIADWRHTDGRDRRLGLLHGILNTAGLAFQLLSVPARFSRRPRRAMKWSAAGFAISTVAAWIGGELVYGRGVMVNRDAWSSGPDQWTAVLPAEDLPERQPKKVDLPDRAILLFREGQRVSAMENTCSHAGGPLDEGECDGETVTCPWHGSRFSLTDGSVRRGPATYPQPRLQARIRAGQVEVRGRKGE